ncbi:hypothetical protein Tco_0726120 [Tanacetum coccineum]|uniref:Uncharacterized protein n=1 Tax=Tanacetum coccineum TaxID=301880 RepID=A0ABQ4YEM7_9ASTR
MPTDTTSNVVLDDDCINTSDLSLSLFGRVKEVDVLSNITNIIGDEGFGNVSIHYLGKLWLMISFSNPDSRDEFLKHTGIASWFSNDFVYPMTMQVNILESFSGVQSNRYGIIELREIQGGLRIKPENIDIQSPSVQAANQVDGSSLNKSDCREDKIEDHSPQLQKNDQEGTHILEEQIESLP